MRFLRERIGLSVDDDWGYIPLSRISQAAYCMRRAALLTNEQIWIENADTAKGRLEHERVHTERIERRGEKVCLYEQTVFSDELHLQGKCDCIEAVVDQNGCKIDAVDFPVRLYPIEFKHGTVREEISYELQLCAQAICLEEMYHTHISEGAIFYITAHRRKTITLDDTLREHVKRTAKELDKLRRSFRIPPAEYGSKCKRCSLRDYCCPKMKHTAMAYCQRIEAEAKMMEEENEKAAGDIVCDDTR